MVTAEDIKGLKDFGKNLRRIRKEKKITLRKMATQAEIDNSKIAKIEKGQINVTFTTILQLAKGLDIAPVMLLDY